jgi:hypothetical protein
MNMDNTWYYTLSTISQTIAAILGLLAVFVALRIQNILKNIIDYKQRALDILEKDITLNKNNFSNADSADSILVELEKLSKKINDGVVDKIGGTCAGIKILSEQNEKNKQLDCRGYLEDTLKNLTIYSKQRDKILKLVKLPSILATLVIVMSIMLLGFGIFFDCKLKISLIIIMVILTISSIGFILINVWKILENIKECE